MSRPRNGVGLDHTLLALGHRDPPCEVRRINYVQKGRKLIRRTEPLKQVPWVGTVRAQSELRSAGPARGLTDRPQRAVAREKLSGWGCRIVRVGLWWRFHVATWFARDTYDKQPL